MEPKVWFAGMNCINDEASCYNSANLPGVDYKCTATNLICIKTDGRKPLLHSLGDMCVNGANGVDSGWHVYSTNNDFQNNDMVIVNVDTNTANQLALKASVVINL